MIALPEPWLTVSDDPTGAPMLACPAVTTPPVGSTAEALALTIVGAATRKGPPLRI